MTRFRLILCMVFGSGLLSGCYEKRATFKESVYDSIGAEMAKIKNRSNLDAAIHHADSVAKANPGDSLTIRLARQDFLRDLMAYRKNYPLRECLEIFFVYFGKRFNNIAQLAHSSHASALFGVCS